MSDLCQFRWKVLPDGKSVLVSIAEKGISQPSQLSMQDKDIR